MIVSPLADAVIEKAQECYVLGLISVSRLETVVRRASTEPGYDALLDLPTRWRIDEARKLWDDAVQGRTR